MGLQCRSLDCSSQFAGTVRERLEAEGFHVQNGKFAAFDPTNVLLTRRDNAQVVVLIEWDYNIPPAPPSPECAARRAKMMAERGITPPEPDFDFPTRLDILYNHRLFDFLRAKLDANYVSRQEWLATDVEEALLRKGQHEIKRFQ